MKYKRSENSMYIYADDLVPRHITSALLMDYDTMAGGDKFGNIFMTRLPADTSTQVGSLPCNVLQLGYEPHLHRSACSLRRQTISHQPQEPVTGKLNA